MGGVGRSRATGDVAYEHDGQGDFTRAALAVLKTAGATLSLATLMQRIVAKMGAQRMQSPQIRAPEGREKGTLTAIPKHLRPAPRKVGRG